MADSPAMSISVCSGHVQVLESLRQFENQIRFGGAAVAAESLESLPISDCQFGFKRQSRRKLTHTGPIGNRQLKIVNASDPLNLIRLTPSKGETAIR
jgi:hypothetical protein